MPRSATPKPPTATTKRRGLNGQGRFVSKAQHRYFAARARRDPAWRARFERAAVRGRYRALPERKSAPSARSAR